MLVLIKRIFNILKKDIVLTAALICGFISCFFCKPTAKEIIGAIDFRVLSLLFSMMTVIAAFKSIKVLDSLSHYLLRSCKTIRSLYLILCILIFFCSAIVTNDVALITFVPITLIVCQQAHIKPLKLIVFETLAANLGSSMMPMGNPQNLFIYSFYKMSNHDFFLTTLKIGIPSFFLLIIFMITATKNFKTTKINDLNTEERAKLSSKGNKDRFNSLFIDADSQQSFKTRQGIEPSARINIISSLGPAGIESGISIYIYSALLIMNLLSVFHIISSYICFAVTLIVILIVNRNLLLQVDYTLLLTFTGFFIFTSNLASIDALQLFFKNILNSDTGTFFAGLSLSQIISNVPAALLLSNFTENAKALLAGVNIGGLGTIIASLASVISYKLYQNFSFHSQEKEPFLPVFTFYNVIFLLILTGLYIAF